MDGEALGADQAKLLGFELKISLLKIEIVRQHKSHSPIALCKAEKKKKKEAQKLEEAVGNGQI